MMNSCGRLVLRPLTQAICEPVFGLNTGETSGPRKLVIRREPPPLASAIHISGSPEREEKKARLRPSGDHAGERLVPPAEEKLTMRFSSKEYMRIWKPSLPNEEKAILELSGAMRGEMETVPS